MSVQEKDLIVLGSGPGGYVAAIRAAQLGRKVSIVERENLGGVCLNWGCIPSKALLRSAQLYHDLKRSAEFGFEAQNVKLDFPKVVARSREVAGKMENGVNFLMRKNKVEVIKGFGSFEKGKKLVVKDSSGKSSTYSYKDVIIAVGAKARDFPGVETDGKVVHVARTILEHKVLPQKLLVIGAGAIGCEFAYFFNSFGTKVTLVEMVDQILPVEDQEIAKALERSFVKQGMTVKPATSISELKVAGKVVSATFKSAAGAEEKWSGDCCLVAVGVKPNTDGIGIENAGVQLDQKGFIKVDEFLKTSAPNHYAIGDCVGGALLAHKASHEGLIAAEVAAGKSKHAMRHDNIAGCTYCQPQVASVGMTEQALKAKGVKYKVGKVPFSAIGKAVAIGEPEGMIKTLIAEDTGELLGVHIMHAEATELITEAAIIRSHEGVAASVIDTIHPHPTLSESMAEALAAALGRPINT